MSVSECVCVTHHQCGADTEPVCPVVICPSSMWGGHWLVTDTRPDFVYNLTIPGVRPVHLVAPPCCLHTNKTVARMFCTVIHF